MPISNRTTAQTLTAAHYNELRNKIVQILGTGSTDYGYGQATTSSTVAGGSTTLVSATHMAQLRADIVKAYVHITSTAFTLEVPDAATELIQATASGTDYNSTHNAFIEAINYCDTNRMTANPTQMTLLNNVGAATAGADWNGTVTTTHRLTFSNGDHERWFFNAGGEVRFHAAHDNNSTSKANDWQQFLTNKVNGITFSFTEYWQHKLASATTFLQQNPDGATVYQDNYHNVTVNSVSAGVIEFTQNFVDADRGDIANTYFWIAAYDEDVIGTTTSNMSIYYPTGSTTDPLLGAITTVQLAAPTVIVV